MGGQSDVLPAAISSTIPCPFESSFLSRTAKVKMLGTVLEAELSNNWGSGAFVWSAHDYVVFSFIVQAHPWSFGISFVKLPSR